MSRKKSEPKPSPSKPQSRQLPTSGRKFIESVLSAYTPDDEFRMKNFKSPMIEFFKALKNPDRKIKGVESAMILEVNVFGAYRTRRITGTAAFKKAIEKGDSRKGTVEAMVEHGVKLKHHSRFTEDAKATCRRLYESKKFRESFECGDTVQTNGAGNPFDEFIPIMGGPFYHQLYLHDFLDMNAKAFEAWNHNPMAHQAIKITTQFVLGRGVTFKAKDTNVQAAYQKWWDDQGMNSRLETWSDMLGLNGELLIRKFKGMLGSFYVRWIDPTTIWEIVTDPEDIEKVFYYHQQYPTQYQVLYGTGSADNKFNPQNFEATKYVINQIPADEVYHVRVNCVPNEKRGRSDLFPSLGWLKRYKDFLTAVVLRAIAQSTFAWKNILKGNDTDVSAFISQFGTDVPEFGSVYVENESSTLTPMTADTKSGQGLADAPGVVNMAAVGFGVPKEYIGISEHSTRATAVVSSEPGIKKFQSRQLTLGRLLKDISKDWGQAQIEAGNFQEGTDMTIEHQFPEIAVEDRSAKLADIALVKQEGAISAKRAASMSANELGVKDYDYDQEMVDIKEEQAQAGTALYQTTAAALNGGASQDTAAPPAKGVYDKDKSGLGSETRRDAKLQNGR